MEKGDDFYLKHSATKAPKYEIPGGHSDLKKRQKEFVVSNRASRSQGLGICSER